MGLCKTCSGISAGTCEIMQNAYGIFTELAKGRESKDRGRSRGCVGKRGGEGPTYEPASGHSSLSQLLIKPLS